MASHASTPVKVGVVGLGRSGWGIHCAYLAGGGIVSSWWPSPTRSKSGGDEAVENLGACAAPDATPEELFADDEVELVVSRLHRTPTRNWRSRLWRRASTSRWKSPSPSNAAEADEMIAKAKAAGRLVTLFSKPASRP